jgi:hypothetical protein
MKVDEKRMIQDDFMSSRIKTVGLPGSEAEAQY